MSEEICDLQELKKLLISFLSDREEIKKLNEKHFKNMNSLFEASKKLYEDTLKIQQDIIHQLGSSFGYKQICEIQSVETEPNEIIITGIPESVKNDPQSMAESVLKSIDSINLKKEIISTRKVSKKRKSQNLNKTSFTSNVNNENKQTSSVIVKLSSPAVVNKIIRHKSLKRNLKASAVFPSVGNHCSSEINVNKVYSEELYKLFLDARAICRLKGLQMPKIVNNVIMVKTDDNHPPIPIRVKNDLENFTRTLNILKDLS